MPSPGLLLQMTTSKNLLPIISRPKNIHMHVMYRISAQSSGILVLATGPSQHLPFKISIIFGVIEMIQECALLASRARNSHHPKLLISGNESIPQLLNFILDTIFHLEQCIPNSAKPSVKGVKSARP